MRARTAWCALLFYVNVLFLGAPAEGAIGPGALLGQISIAELGRTRPNVLILIFNRAIDVEFCPFVLKRLNQIWDENLGKPIVFESAEKLQLSITSRNRIYSEAGCLSVDWGQDEFDYLLRIAKPLAFLVAAVFSAALILYTRIGIGIGMLLLMLLIVRFIF